MAVFEEADMALRTLGGALDRYNGGSELNCGEFMMYADILANVKVPEVSGIWVDLHAIYVKAANHATTAIEGVVSTCKNNEMGMLKPGSINQLTFGVARMGINEAIEVLRPALLVAAEQPDAPELHDDMPEGDMPEGDMPEGDMPEGDMPEGDMPEGDMPEGDMPEGDMPEGDMPEGDMPEGDMPEYDGDCVIPESGSWPACATGADAPKPNVPADCLIPASGSWPACATGANAPRPNVPADCIIPASGPWPACATGADSKPDVPADCVIPGSGPWPECAKNAPQKK